MSPPPPWRVAEVTVACEDGEFRVRGICYGALAITAARGEMCLKPAGLRAFMPGYVVTHVPSGRRVSGPLPLPAAARYLRDIARLADWNQASADRFMPEQVKAAQAAWEPYRALSDRTRYGVFARGRRRNLVAELAP
jgi:hypothetical protein